VTAACQGRYEREKEGGVLSAFANAFRTPDLRKKILFTLMILAIFRLGSIIPVPNVNVKQVDFCLKQATSGDTQGLYSLINLFSGGALLHLAIFALGIMPYITASIILQLLTVVIPRLEALKKEGASGQTKITQYTRYLTLVLAVLNSTAFVTLAVNDQLFTGCTGIVYDNSNIFVIIVMILTMTAGTSVIMWLGELITERGIGNGMSVMIFTQIAATFPAALWGLKVARPGANGWVVFLLVCLLGLIVMAGVIFIEQSQRRIPVQYAKRMVGRRMFGGTTTYIPIKVNQAGVIPVIFASSLLYLPALYAQFRPNSAGSSWIQSHFVRGDHPIYMISFFLLIVFFCYFYVAITFNPEEVADNMKKYGGFIPGIRAGKPTQDYLAYVLSRLTFPGSLYLGLIALLPSVAFIFLNANQNFPFGGTSILIIVGVGLDTVKQIESQLQQRHYEGFLR
jgi:preprotein translocase subunit SecY